MLVSKDEGEPAARFTFFYAVAALILLAGCKKQEIDIASGFSPLPVAKAPPPPKPTIATNKKKKIYLTFDDGPNKGTMNVLRAVTAEQVPATFFLVAEHAFASPWQKRVWDSLQLAVNIELCNHSDSHAHNRYSSYYVHPDTVVNDFRRSHAKLAFRNNVVRAPGRNTWRIDSLRITDIRESGAALDSLHRAGFQVMGWDLEWHFDPKTMSLSHTADDLLSKVDRMFTSKKTRMPDNLVILAHDQAYTTEKDVNELLALLRRLKTHEEYELAVVTHYPALQPSAIK